MTKMNIYQKPFPDIQEENISAPITARQDEEEQASNEDKNEKETKEIEKCENNVEKTYTI